MDGGGGGASALEQQGLVALFLDIAVGQTVETASQFLQITNWNLDEAIQLFFLQNEGGSVPATLPATSHSPLLENERPMPNQNSGSDKHQGDDIPRYDDGSEVRAPLPVTRDVLYDSPLHYGVRTRREARSVVPFRNFDEELKHPGVWETDQGGTSSPDSSRDKLASLYRPPFALMYIGSFEKAKDAAKAQNKWLLVNLQSIREFSSHMLNRDTWANEAVSQTIISNFIFWQVTDDTEEGSKVCTYYKLDSVPVTLVLDPVTGQKMRMWRGMIQPESLLEDLIPFMDGSPKDHHFNLSHKRPRETSRASPPRMQDGSDEDEELLLARIASMEGMKDSSELPSNDTADTKPEEEIPEKEKLDYPPLPEEPTGDRSLLCRVGVRLPDGRRLQRNFFRSDPVQLLWSFCYAQIGEANGRPFRLTQNIPGALKLDYNSKLTFEESGLANSMVSVTWE